MSQKNTSIPELSMRLVMIEWVDSSRLSDGGWMDLDAIPDPYPHRCVSVGFVVRDNDSGLVVVPTVADLDHEDNRHTFGGLLIPKAAIVSQKELGSVTSP